MLSSFATAVKWIANFNASKWSLAFNPDKCKVMHIGHNIDTGYTMSIKGRNWTLENLTEEKDLGVHTNSNLTPSQQCIKSVMKAMSVFGMMKRRFGMVDREDFLLVYKTYVRPHVEFCIQAWSPHLKRDIQCLEKVQRRATRMVIVMRNASYEIRLMKLELISLAKGGYEAVS